MAPLFPREDEFNDVFLRVAAETGVPYCVLKGFVALESAFNPKAYRYEPHINDASYGLAQVLVRTARGVGYQGTPEGLFDPYQSVLCGGRFIRNLSKKYPSLSDVVAAYNMGYPRKIAATTPLIASIYKYPLEFRERPPEGWVYANEPYHWRVMAYIAYYEARQANEMARAEEILGLIRAKDTRGVFQRYGARLNALKWGVQTCPTCGKQI